MKITSAKSVSGIEKYIKYLANPKYDEPMASYVNWSGGTAAFWYDQDVKKYQLVIMSDDSFNHDTYVYEHSKFWGDEELSEVNDTYLTAGQLYKELAKLPGVNLENYYGMNAVFNDHPELRDGIKSSVTASEDTQIYKVTYGYDVGGPEDGPIMRSGERFTEATSEDDACKKFDAEWGKADPGYYEGCWAKLATPEEIEQWKEEQAAEEAMWKEYHEWFGDDEYAEDVESAEAITASKIKIPAPYSKYYQIYESGYPFPEEGIQNILDDYDLTYVADVVAKPKYEDRLSENGLDLGTLAADEDGKMRVYLIAGGNVYDMLGEIELLSDEGGMRPVSF